jgi:GH24 family phage-related lysozyme (muramidase)
MSYLEDSADLLRAPGFEGTVPYMYLDTVGLVTVGVGQMIPDEDEAETYPFVHSNGVAATGPQIRAEYLRVHKMGKAQLPGKYHTKNSLILTDDYIRSLVLKRVKEFDGDLRGHYKNYDSYPNEAKLALLDMIYNLGPDRLFGQYKQFAKSVNAQNWGAAAKQCHRRGPSPKRNAWAAHQFELAAKKNKAVPLPVHPALTQPANAHALPPHPLRVEPPQVKLGPLL